MIIDIIKKYKVIIVVVGIIIVSGCLIKFGTEIYKQKKYENEIIDALNNDTMYDFIDENEMKAHKYAKMEVPKEYDITFAIDTYIENIETCIDNKINNTKKKYKIIDAMPIGDNMLVNGFKYEDEFNFIKNLITERDIEEYINGTFRQNLIKKLKESIRYKERNDIINWYVDNDCDKIIELPYNVYINFRYSDKKNTGVKKVTKIKFLDKENEMCYIEYEMNDGTLVKDKFGVVHETKDNKMECLLTSFNGIYYDITHEARLNFGQHDVDKSVEEWSKIQFEIDKAKNRVQISDKTIEIPQFQKYDVGAYIRVITYDDGVEVWFNSTKWIVKDGKNDVEHKNYRLYYDDVKTPEEALERYLKDEEHFKADEEFLKTNNRYYTED